MDEPTKRLLAKAREHYESQEYDKAEPLLYDVLKRHEGFADVHNMLGVIAHEHGQFDQAEHHLQRATQLNPNYTEALLNLAVTYNDQGKHEQGRAIRDRMDASLTRNADPCASFIYGKIANMHADIAQAYEEAGMRSDAIREMERAVSMCPTFADLQTRLGSLYRDAGDMLKARIAYETARNINPKYIQARILLGITLLVLHDREGATREWRAVLKQDPHNKNATMYLRMVESGSQSTRTP